MHRLSLVMVSGDSLVVAVNRLLIAVVSLVAEHRLWSTGSVVVAMLHRLSSPRHVTSSPTRDRTCVPWVGRQILIHCTTREDLKTFFWMWTIFKVFTELLTTLPLFDVLFSWPRRKWDFSSPTRDQTLPYPLHWKVKS